MDATEVLRELKKLNENSHICHRCFDETKELILATSVIQFCPRCESDLIKKIKEGGDPFMVDGVEFVPVVEASRRKPISTDFTVGDQVFILIPRSLMSSITVDPNYIKVIHGVKFGEQSAMFHGKTGKIKEIRRPEFPKLPRGAVMVEIPPVALPGNAGAMVTPPIFLHPGWLKKV